MNDQGRGKISARRGGGRNLNNQKSISRAAESLERAEAAADEFSNIRWKRTLKTKGEIAG